MTAPNDEVQHFGRRMEVDIRVDAPALQAWQAWADPARVSQWFTDRARGKPEAGETLTWIFDTFGYEVPYPVVRAQPGELLVLGGEYPPGNPFALEIRIERDDDATIIRVVNSGFMEGPAGDAQFADVRSGWQLALGILREYLEKHFGEPKHSRFVMRPVPLGSSLQNLFHNEAGLASWLTTSGEIADRAGAPVLLRLQGGGTVTGEVLAVSDGEVALSWQEVGGTLELKQFSAAPGERMIGLRVFSWRDDAALAAVEPVLTAALHRLADQLT